MTTALRPLAALALLLGTLLAAASCGEKSAPATMTVVAGGKSFACKVAADMDTREMGMGQATSIGPDEGMIFAFPDAQPRRFWMRRCVIDLDIAFIDPFGFVTAVHTMPKEELQRPDETEEQYLARLKGYPSGAPAQFALEVAPGTLAPLGIRQGSRIEFDRDTLKRIAK